MRIAHVRDRHGPVGAPWRLVAALDAPAPPAAPRPALEPPARWLDLEVARRRAVAHDPTRAHHSTLFRSQLSTLDELLARGLRLDALGELVDGFEARSLGDDAVLAAGDLEFGPPILRPPSLRDFYAFEGHVRPIWERRGADVPEAWYRLPIFYFSNTSEIRGPGAPVWAPAASKELDFELEIAAIIDAPVKDAPADVAGSVIGGFMILNDWSARDLQREETALRLGPAKGKDFATSIGPWIVTPDELSDAQTGTGYDLAMTATVNGTEVSRGRWADAQFSFGEMIARASQDVHLRPGELIGSGTVGTGCLLEVREATIGRYLEPGDEVTLRVDRLGALHSPVVARDDGVTGRI